MKLGEDRMSTRTRMIRKLAALMTVVGVAGVGLVASAMSAAAARVVPPGGSPATGVQELPATATPASGGGIEWWAVLLIALAAAAFAAAVTAFLESRHHRHVHVAHA